MDTTETPRPSGKRVRRRRSHVINRAFQWRYTLLISGSVFFISVFASLVLFGVLYEQARARMMSPETSYAWQNTVVMILSSLVFSLVTAGAIGLWSIFVTHRIAGPLFVLERYFREMIDGGLPTVRALRTKDEFKELHDTFRKLVETLKARRQADLATLTETLKIARSSEAKDAERQQEALKGIAGRIEELRLQAVEFLPEKVTSIPSEPNSTAP